MDREGSPRAGAPSRLASFAIGGGGQTFTLRIEDDAGRVTTVTASRDQLDVIADHLDDALLGEGPGDEPA